MRLPDAPPRDAAQGALKQFQVLTDAANRRFNKLRTAQEAQSVPGWTPLQESYQKCFARFNELWRFQLENRPALLQAGLQRSELGSIASKIGQLYYNYYLRSADTGALQESYVFYEAIHSRQYFGSPADAAAPAAATRQLRFYARFIVVCLLLNRKEEALAHLQELQASIAAYVMRFRPADAADWQLVAAEASAFMAADVCMPVPRSPGSAISFKPPMRCRPNGPEATCAPHRCRLREAVLVSYNHRQVKIAELPLDLFRIMLSLEWQDPKLGDGSSSWGDSAAVQSGPSFSSGLAVGLGGGAIAGADWSTPAASSSGAAGVPGGSAGSGSSGGRTGRNPPKRVLYRPTAQQLLGTLLSSSTPLQTDDLMLVYIACDATPTPPAAAEAEAPGSSSSRSIGVPAPGGDDVARLLLLCPPQHPPAAAAGAAQQQQQQQQPAGAAAGSGGLSAALSAAPAHQQQQGQDCVLWPEELLAATRRRVLLIVDSDMSHDFMQLQDREHGPPLLCLMSPQRVSSRLGANSTSTSHPHQHGRLMAMALACPAMALCVLAGAADPGPATLQQLQELLDEGMRSLGQELAAAIDGAAAGGSRVSGRSSPWGVAFQDALTRQHVLRFALFRCALARHPASEGGRPELLPCCFPPLPPAADPGAAGLCSTVRGAAALLGAADVFGGGDASLAALASRDTSAAAPTAVATSGCSDGADSGMPDGLTAVEAQAAKVEAEADDDGAVGPAGEAQLSGAGATQTDAASEAAVGVGALSLGQVLARLQAGR